MSEQEPRGHSGDLDLAIDGVARDMLDAEAPDSMRAAVLARLEAGPRAGWFAGLHRPAVWAVAAAGVAVAIGVWVGLPHVRQQPQPAQAVARGIPAPGAVPEASPAQSAVAAAAAAPGDAGSAATNPVGTRRAAPRPERPRPDAYPDELPRLAGPEPLTIDPLAPAPLAIEDIRVTPMNPVPTLELPGLDEVRPEKDPVDPNRKER